MAAQIKELQDQANQLGEEGEVDESMKKMAEVEAIKVKKDILKSVLKRRKIRLLQKLKITLKKKKITLEKMAELEAIQGQEEHSEKCCV